MKIVAVGWNYSSHNTEMGVANLSIVEPTIFMKADSSILKDGKPFFLPSHFGAIEYEGELVVKIDRIGKNIAPQFANRYYHEVTVGVDFTARELQKKLREKGEPWEISKSFDGAAVIGEFVSLEELGGMSDLNFTLNINGETRQAAHINNMIHSIDQIIAYVSKFFTLKIGDLIFTGTPSGTGQVKLNDHIQGYINKTHEVLCFNVK